MQKYQKGSYEIKNLINIRLFFERLNYPLQKNSSNHIVAEFEF
jgi:hypothetical protein